MNIEIVGMLLERLTALAELLRGDPEYLAPEVFRKGLEVMEYRAATQKSKEPHSSKSKTYIREHWETQTDEEMALVLGIQAETVRVYRGTLGLMRRKSLMFAPVLHPSENGAAPAMSSLSDTAKADIAAHPERSHEDMAVSLCANPLQIKKYRVELAGHFLSKGEWPKETDGAIGARFGLNFTDISTLRRASGMFRLRSQRSEKVSHYIALLGGADAIKEALQNGGKTITELFLDKGITSAVLSRERMRQLIGTVGLTGEKEQHTLLWYAARTFGPERAELAQELSNPETFRRRLAEAGSLPALAGKLRVSETRLRGFAEKAGLTSAEDKLLCGQRGVLIALVCSTCGGTFCRPKARVEREKRKYPDKKTWFCNKTCQGSYVAKHYGFGAPRRTKS